MRLHPSIDEIQEAINRSAVAILNCSKCVRQWEIKDAENGRHATSAPCTNCFTDRLKEERDIQKVLLRFLGSVQNIRDEVAKYIVKFDVRQTMTFFRGPRKRKRAVDQSCGTVANAG